MRCRRFYELSSALPFEQARELDQAGTEGSSVYESFSGNFYVDPVLEDDLMLDALPRDSSASDSDSDDLSMTSAENSPLRRRTSASHVMWRMPPGDDCEQRDGSGDMRSVTPRQFVTRF